MDSTANQPSEGSDIPSNHSNDSEERVIQPISREEKKGKSRQSTTPWLSEHDIMLLR